MRSANAFTLLEVVIVLTLLGLVLGISTVALVSLRPPHRAHWVAVLDSSRTAAIRSGTPVVIRGSQPDTSRWLFLPDGRVLGPNVEVLTGTPHDAR